MTDPQYPAQPPVPPQPPYPAAQQPYPSAPPAHPPQQQPYPAAQQPYPSAPPAYPPQQQPYGAPQAPGYPYGAYPVRPATGTVAWAMGFLSFIPYLGILAAPIVMAALYPSMRRHGGVAAENGRGAANWGLTYLTATLASILLAIIGGVGGDGVRWVLIIAGILFLVVAITHLVTTIVGTVKASGGKVFVPAYAIPFFRG